jgi:hypothetical protein
MLTNFREILKTEDTSENLGIDGKIILKCIIKEWDIGAWTGCTSLPQDRTQWWALVRTAVNVRVA